MHVNEFQNYSVSLKSTLHNNILTRKIVDNKKKFCQYIINIIYFVDSPQLEEENLFSTLSEGDQLTHVVGNTHIQIEDMHEAP